MRGRLTKLEGCVRTACYTLAREPAASPLARAARRSMQKLRSALSLALSVSRSLVGEFRVRRALVESLMKRTLASNILPLASCARPPDKLANYCVRVRCAQGSRK